MRARWVLPVIAAGTLIVAVPSGAHGATVAPITCGATITVDTRLRSDLRNCPGIGIVIGADDVRLNLNGHVVDGDGIGDFEGIQVQGHRGVTIENGSVRDFVEGVAVLNARQTSVRRLSLFAHRHAGVFVSDSEDIAVEETKSIEIEFPGVFITRSHNVSVGRNVVSASGSGIGVRMSDHVHVTGNTLTRNTCEGISVADDATDNVIEGNTVSANGCDGITFTNGSDRNLVRGNTVIRNIAGVGIVTSNDNVVADNSLRDNAFVGAYVFGGDRNRISGNITTGNGDGSEGGIHVLPDDAGNAPTSNTISNNIVTANTGDGILVDAGSINTLIRGNVAARNTDDGIDIDSPGATVTGNDADRNGDLGIEAVIGVVDGGANAASRNANPLQCVNVSCR